MSKEDVCRFSDIRVVTLITQFLIVKLPRSTDEGVNRHTIFIHSKTDDLLRTLGRQDRTTSPPTHVYYRVLCRDWTGLSDQYISTISLEFVSLDS